MLDLFDGDDFFTPSEKYISECDQWLANEFEGLTDKIEFMSPSEWAEQNRYLPASVTPLPGYYSFGVTPYLREIVDNMDPQVPVREVTVMKGVQTCYTVGVLENTIGYSIGHIKTAPTMMLTVDSEVAKIRMDQYITPMIDQSGLSDLIQSSDEKNTRKTGKTDKKIEWKGGGFLVPFGAQNANKHRSISILYMLEDENDAFPDRVGKDGDPQKLAEDRTAAFEQVRKILRGSTPLITQTSRIYREYKRGDQRMYMVPCKHCDEKQRLEWTGVNDDGTVYGIEWETDDKGFLIPGSVRYMCKHCGGTMVNEDKAWMYRDAGKYCEWVPTAESENPAHRSYHISALYSPVGMQTWEQQVRKWLDAWDVAANRAKNLEALQLFYNNVLGRPFELRGEALKFEKVVMHRRPGYISGEIPNSMAKQETGDVVQVLTAAVDVHKSHLDVQIIGWCDEARFYSIEWLVFEGDCENISNEPWQQLRELIETKIYKADDGKLYQIQLTLVDAGYNADLVYSFCNNYSGGVYPIQGRDLPNKSAALKEFSPFKSKVGTVGYHVTVTIYKDRLAAALRGDWDGISIQPAGHPNFPQNYPDQFFKELTVETKREKINAVTGQRMGVYWHKPGNAANHAWDLTVYNSAALDMVALDVCEHHLELLDEEDKPYLNWQEFWKYLKEEGLFYA